MPGRPVVASHSPAPSSTEEPTEPFLRACRGLPTDFTPVWFMRQSGRYLPAYQRLIEQYTLFDIMSSPELSAELAVQPVHYLGVDAAIPFFDILHPLSGMGLEIKLDGPEGPRLAKRIDRTYDIDILATPPAEEHLSFALEAVRTSKEQLRPLNVPLIGVIGAPFTLAMYAIEGGVSRTFSRTKAIMMNKPAAWKRLMTKLVTVLADFGSKQVGAGADAVQVFDSWVGHACSREDFETYVAPYNRILYERLAMLQAPIINYSGGTSAYIKDVATAGGDVLGVDWQMPLDWHASQLGSATPIQGNLDPHVFFAPWREQKYRIDRMLDQASAVHGYIFNTGAGLLPATSADKVKRLVDYVHEQTCADASSQVG